MSPAPFFSAQILWEKQERFGKKRKSNRGTWKKLARVWPAGNIVFRGQTEEHRGSVRSDRPAPGGGIAKC